ncbi:unnamed protein product [Psylliodes chrysocephalus]|uniref:DUF4371 domain-containing protein n=1 Tax=Psylliodes chrysocephalus TaxID=3402493 RepID=A0A9P0D718_9CUCU|nr:unnamed protein product [Psylliodes chrysocephala]
MRAYRLCHLCIKAGDSQLGHHFQHGPKNASYRSPIIQNEIIDLCGASMKEQINLNVIEACAYSILADETAEGLNLKHFFDLVDALETLAEERNGATRKSVYQMHAAACKSSFIVLVSLIAKYSAILEPVANILQMKTLDIVKANEHIQTIVEMLRDHRKNAENVTAEIITEIGDIAKPLNVDITFARIAGRQKHRNNPPVQNPGDFNNSLLRFNH